MSSRSTANAADLANAAYDLNIRTTVEREMRELPPGINATKDDYVLYILRSQPSPNRTYCGTTNNMKRRLRQHNGLLSGGARATSTGKPWVVAGIIHNFSSKSLALRFEWFCKIKHCKQKKGLRGDALQRRAKVVAGAFDAVGVAQADRLVLHMPDPYFRQCMEEALDRRLTVPGMLLRGQRPPPQPGVTIIFVDYTSFRGSS